MKAIIYEQYGSPDVLKMRDLPVPVPKGNEVLVQVYTTSINASDYEFLTGSPLYVRAWGFRKPSIPILGSDIAGKVVAVGLQVTKFRKGDAVFGDIIDQKGGLAEYVCAPAKAMTLIPDGMDFEDASAVPQASLVAMQALKYYKPVQAGDHILINGAGGGAGSFAIQLAKLWGAEVTGVDSAVKSEMIRSLGADHFINYREEDFTENGKKYDRIVDFVAAHSIFRYRRSLQPKGVYVMVGGQVRHLLQALVVGSLLTWTGNRKLGLLPAVPNKGMNEMLSLIEAGKVRPVIDRSYKLEEAAEAFNYFGKGLPKGKVIIKCKS